MKQLSSLVGACLSAALFAACGGPGALTSQSGPSSTLPAQRQVARIAPTSKTGPTLYVLNCGGGQAYSASIYASGGASLLRNIDIGAYSDGFTVDPLGHLYVGYPATYNPNGEGLLDIYGVRGSKLIRTLHQKHPFGQLTLDPSGSLFTLCADDRLCEYADAKQHVTRRIALTKFGGGHTALAVDGTGDLAVDTWAGPVLVFAPGATQPYWKISSGIYESTALAFDASGNLYVYTYADALEIAVYAPGGTSPVRTISNGIRDSIALTFDGKGNLYTLNYGAPESVTVYPPGGSAPILTISSGLNNAKGLAVDTLGNVYVANEGVSASDPGSVTVYPPGGSSPSRTVTHGVQKPISVGVGP